MHRLFGRVAALTLLISPYAAAQSTLGVAQAPGITFHPPAQSANPDPAPAEVLPPTKHDHHSWSQPGQDLFLAGPDTYAPRVGRHARFRSRYSVLPYALAPIPYFLPGDYAIPVTSGRRVDGFFVGSAADDPGAAYALEPAPHRVELKADGRLESLDTPASPPTVPVLPLSTPKTLYVIPRCYAGDRPPVAGQLPAGCSIANLRVIPPDGR